MKKTTAAPIVRTLETADPAYADAKALVGRLRASMSDLDREEAELLHRLSTRPTAPEVTGRVAKLLGDAPADDDATPDGNSARLRALAAERVDLRAALNIASQRLASARFGASRVICEEVRTAYTERVKALAAALLAVHQARVELHELIDQLNVNDIAWTGNLPPMHADRTLSKIGIWLKDAVDGGFIPKSSIPTELI